MLSKKCYEFIECGILGLKMNSHYPFPRIYYYYSGNDFIDRCAKSQDGIVFYITSN